MWAPFRVCTRCARELEPKNRTQVNDFGCHQNPSHGAGRVKPSSLDPLPKRLKTRQLGLFVCDAKQTVSRETVELQLRPEAITEGDDGG